MTAAGSSNTTKTNKRYSMFDVPHEQQELVSTEERETAAAKPKTIQEVMKDVVAFVEVRSGHDNRTEGIKNVMKMLGATVCDKIDKKTTHVIFKGGRLSTYQRAKKLGIPMVPIMWIEACKKHLVLADPNEFEISHKELYENPDLYKKTKRVKAMQPEAMPSRAAQSESGPGTPQLALKPLRFHTPSAATIHKELQEISNKIEEMEDDEKDVKLSMTEKAPKMEKAAVPVKIEKSQSDDKVVQRRKTICVPQLSQLMSVRVEKTEANTQTGMNTNIWALALANVKQLVKSPKEIKTEVKSIVDDVNNDTVATPSRAKTQKRRTLFTPDIFETKESTTPAVVKPEKRRRTLYTPGSEFKPFDFKASTEIIKTPKVTTKKATPQTQPRRTVFKFGNNTTTVNFSFSKIHSSSSQRSTSHTRVKAAIIDNSSSDMNLSVSVNVNVSVNMMTPKSSTAKKHRLCTEEVKENTPPRPKLKPMLFPTPKMVPRMIKLNKMEDENKSVPTPETPIAKRRRTMVPMTK